MNLDGHRPVRVPLGPSPWNWQGRSVLSGGTTYRFESLQEHTKLSGITAVRDLHGDVVLLLNFYVYGRLLDDGRMLLWWEEEKKGRQDLAFACFDVSSLPRLEDPEKLAARMKADEIRTSGLENTRVHRFPSLQDAGSHPIQAPEAWKDFEETIVLADHREGPGPHRAVFVFDWIESKVTVLPQDWFNEGDYDFGYQWVTRVARSESGELLGDGIRIGPFVLDSSGRQIKRWLNQSPFRNVQ